MYGCVALDRESVAKTPCKRRYCTDICNSYKENRQEEEKQSEKEEKAEKKPSPVLEEAIKQLLMLDPKYQDLIVSEINTLTLRQSLL